MNDLEKGIEILNRDPELLQCLLQLDQVQGECRESIVSFIDYEYRKRYEKLKKQFKVI